MADSPPLRPTVESCVIITESCDKGALYLGGEKRLFGKRGTGIRIRWGKSDTFVPLFRPRCFGGGFFPVVWLSVCGGVGNQEEAGRARPARATG